jgi:hypothetical protein
VTSAEQTIKLDNALLAIRVTTSVKELAFSPLQTIVLLLMLAARYGIGTLIHAQNALISGILLKDFVYLSLIIVKHLMKLTDNVFHAMVAMTFLRVHASSLLLTLLQLLMLAAKSGKVEFAKSAHLIGSSTTLEFAFPYQTNAAPTTLQVANV